MIKRRSGNIFFPYLIFLCLSLLLVLSERVGLGFIRYPLEVVFIPPQRILTAMKTQLVVNSKLLISQDIQQKISQGESYQKELDVLKAKVQLLEKENNALKKQLECPLPPQWQFIPAQVLGRERFLLLDKGKRDGVTAGMPVISENILIGKVFSIGEKTAQVMLLWDPEMKITVTTDKGVKGLLIGEFGNQIKLSRVLQKDSLTALDTISTLGEEGVYPPNLLIGKISEVNAKQEDIYKEAKVAPLIDYDKLQNIFIVAKF